MNSQIALMTSNLQIQNEKLNELKYCQRQLLMKGEINF